MKQSSDKNASTGNLRQFTILRDLSYSGAHEENTFLCKSFVDYLKTFISWTIYIEMRSLPQCWSRTCSKLIKPSVKDSLPWPRAESFYHERWWFTRVLMRRNQTGPHLSIRHMEKPQQVHLRSVFRLRPEDSVVHKHTSRRRRHEKTICFEGICCWSTNGLIPPAWFNCTLDFSGKQVILSSNVHKTTFPSGTLALSNG